MHKHIRLQSHDYSSVGMYFITLTLKNPEYTLSEILDATSFPNALGKALEVEWNWIPTRFPHMCLDEFIIVPDHVHGIIGIRENFLARHRTHQQFGMVSGSVSVAVNQFKGNFTRWCRANGYEHFKWQPRFYDSVIRNHAHLENVRDYIRNNPARWEQKRSRL
jgi:putative transposase